MKKKLLFVLSMMVSLALASCSMEDDHGYPKVVEMPAEGGTTKIYGKEPPYRISIVSTRGEPFVSYNEGDTLVASCEWLTIRQKEYGYIIALSAEPNLTGEKRKLKVMARFAGNTYTTIDVVQKK